MAKNWDGFSKTKHLKNLIHFENFFFSKSAPSQFFLHLKKSVTKMLQLGQKLEWVFENRTLKIFELILKKKFNIFLSIIYQNASLRPKIGMGFKKRSLKNLILKNKFIFLASAPSRFFFLNFFSNN